MRRIASLEARPGATEINEKVPRSARLLPVCNPAHSQASKGPFSPSFSFDTSNLVPVARFLLSDGEGLTAPDFGGGETGQISMRPRGTRATESAGTQEVCRG